MSDSDDRPTSEEILEKWVNRSTLTGSEVQTAALDALDFIATVLEGGGQLFVKYPKGELVPMEFTIPGITTES